MQQDSNNYSPLDCDPVAGVPMSDPARHAGQRQRGNVPRGGKAFAGPSRCVPPFGSLRRER